MRSLILTGAHRRALFTKAQLKAGQNVLITGIGGGVALIALQLAVAAKANVYVTGGNEAKIQRAVQLGAVGGAVYKDAKWPAQIRELLAQKSKDKPYLDAVIDSAGGEVTAQSAKAALKTGGKIVCFGMTADPKLTVTMREVLRNVDVCGSTMGSADEFRAMVAFVAKHKIEPIIDTVLEGLDEAHKGFVSTQSCEVHSSVNANNIRCPLCSQPLLQDADKRSGGKVIVRIVDSESRARL